MDKNYLLEYYSKIQSKEIVVCRKLKRQLDKLVRDINDPNCIYEFDLERANRPIVFIETFCKTSKGKVDYIKLDLFQKAFISALFGFVHKETKFRRYKEAFFYVARKNGKSTLLAAILVYMLVADGEAGADCFTVATKKDQAKLVFDEAYKMIQQSSDLNRHIKKRKSDLYFPATFSKAEALSSDSDTLDGLSGHLIIIDELHSIKSRNLYEVMQQSMSARNQPLLVMITTAGTIRECIFDDIYEYAEKVVNDTIKDERFLTWFYELDSRDEYLDSKKWQKANPALGTIKKQDDLFEKVERAKAYPKNLKGVLVKDFNFRETSNSSWLDFDVVNNNKTFELSEIHDHYAVAGVDLSSTTDLTCATILVPTIDKELKIIQQYFLPSETIEIREKEDKIPYTQWHKQGLLTLCEGTKVDYNDVTNWFIKMREEHELYILYVGYDSWNSQYWQQDMENNGFNMEKVIQGARTMSSPMKEMEADLKAKRINYNNNPILKWCLLNTEVKVDDNENIRPVKNNQRKRIDGAVALIDAYVVYMNHYEELQNLI